MPSEDQRIDALWAGIERQTRRNMKIKNTVRPNSSGYACVDNQHLITVKTNSSGPAIPIHGHQWTLPHQASVHAAAAAEIGYSAAQSPETDCTNLLIHGIDSGEGIFQFISPRSHQSGRSTHGPSIIQMLARWKTVNAANPTEPLRLGDRYEVVGFEPVDGSHANSQHVRYALTVRDLVTAKESIVPITQAGLEFSDRVLQADDIVRADRILNSHIAANNTYRAATASAQRSADEMALNHGPLLVSHAGIGRNAALITYRDISVRIVNEKSVNHDNLDDTLRQIILESRQARGPKFLHSKNQLRALRQALLDLIEQTDDKSHRSALEEQRGRRMFSLSATSSVQASAVSEHAQVADLNIAAGDGASGGDLLPAQNTDAPPEADPFLETVEETVIDATTQRRVAQPSSATTTATATTVILQSESPPASDRTPPQPEVSMLGGEPIGHEAAPVCVPEPEQAPLQTAVDNSTTRTSATIETTAATATTAPPATATTAPSATTATTAAATEVETETRPTRRSFSSRIATSLSRASSGTWDFLSSRKDGGKSESAIDGMQLDGSPIRFTQQNPMVRRRPKNHPAPNADAVPSRVTGSTIPSPPSEQAAASTLASTGALSMGNDQLQIFNFTASQLNMSMINTRITQKDVGGTHQIKAISGAGNECWWRAAWLSALIQHSQSNAPAVHLETTLVEKLGDQFSPDAKRITDMIKGIRKRGISAVMTNMYSGKSAEKMATESRLKLPHRDNDENRTRGEDVCRRLTNALLAHTGTSLQTREKLFKNNEAGHEMLVATLCNELECDVIVHSKPWKQTPFEVESVLVCPQPNSRLHALQAQANNPDALTARLIKAVGQIPVITTRSGHFNLAIPVALAPT